MTSSEVGQAVVRRLAVRLLTRVLRMAKREGWTAVEQMAISNALEVLRRAAWTGGCDGRAVEASDVA
jgi:hypothetical protein